MIEANEIFEQLNFNINSIGIIMKDSSNTEKRDLLEFYQNDLRKIETGIEKARQQINHNIRLKKEYNNPSPNNPYNHVWIFQNEYLEIQILRLEQKRKLYKTGIHITLSLLENKSPY